MICLDCQLHLLLDKYATGLMVVFFFKAFIMQILKIIFAIFDRLTYYGLSFQLIINNNIMKPNKIRNMVVLGMLLHKKGGKMRDRRLRRPKDAKQKKNWEL